MHSKSKPLSRKQLADYEATRDLAADLLQSIKEMKAGSTPTVTTVSERVEVARTGATVGEKVECVQPIYDSAAGQPNIYRNLNKKAKKPITKDERTQVG